MDDSDEGSSKLVNSCSIYFSEDMFRLGSLVIFNSNNFTETKHKHNCCNTKMKNINNHNYLHMSP